MGVPRWLGLWFVLWFVLGAPLLVGGCLTPDPLRAPWLYDGLYPPEASGVADIDRPGSSPSAQPPEAPPLTVDAQVAVPGFGVWVARSVAPGTSVSGRAYVAPTSQPIRLLDASRPRVPGFLFDLDLRSYKSIAFVADTASWLCADSSSNPPREKVAPKLAAMADALGVAIAGLRADQSFVVIQGADGRLERFAPSTGEGRRMAAEWLRGTVCGGIVAPARLLKEAYAGSPEVVVLLSQGIEPTEAEREWFGRVEEGGCATDPDPLFCTDPAKSAAKDPRRRPVLAVAFEAADSPWMRRLADATGGAFIHAAR